MSDKTVIVETREKNYRFKVSESGGALHVHRVDRGAFMDSYSKLGKAKNLEDALALIKSSVNSSIQKIDIS